MQRVNEFFAELISSYDEDKLDSNNAEIFLPHGGYLSIKDKNDEIPIDIDTNQLLAKKFKEFSSPSQEVVKLVLM